MRACAHCLSTCGTSGRLKGHIEHIETCELPMQEPCSVLVGCLCLRLWGPFPALVSRWVAQKMHMRCKCSCPYKAEGQLSCSHHIKVLFPGGLEQAT